MPVEGGPWLTLAAFCEHVIEDKRGVLSLIGLVDRISIGARGPGVPDSLPPLAFKIRLVLGFRAGTAVGRGNVRVDAEGPDGLVRPGPSFGITFAGPSTGVNRLLDLNMQVEQEGVYWFTIWFDQQRMAQIPLHIIYEPEIIPSGPDPE